MKVAPVFLIVALLSSTAVMGQMVNPQPVMTNATIEAMIRGGIPVATVVQAIQSARDVDFLISSYEFSQLIKAGASDRAGNQILEAMHQRLVHGTSERSVPISTSAPLTSREQLNLVNPVSVNPVPVNSASATPVSAESIPASPTQTQILDSGVEPTLQARPTASSMTAGSKIFISVMEGELDGFIAAEIIKQRLPVTVVTSEKNADFILSGASIKADDKWYHVIFGGKDKNEGNVRLLDVKSRTMVWAGEAGDRSLWYSNFRRGGERKVAQRIVHQMKKDVKF